MNKASLKKIAANDVAIAIKEDLGSGDITTKLLGKEKNRLSTAILKSNENGILCGQQWFDCSFKHVQKLYGGSLKIKWNKKDGDEIKKNEVICKIIAPLKVVLIGERTALNFIQLLSGISTKVNLYVQKINNNKTKILDTRKTIPGLRISQKYAVKCGGGSNHRYGLYDQILIKENHITEKTLSLDSFLDQLRGKVSFRKISIEVENIYQLKKILRYKPKNILLDNFSISNIKKACKIIDKKMTTVEVSGGVNLQNIDKFVQCNINFISVGDLTKNIKSVDFSLTVLK